MLSKLHQKERKIMRDLIKCSYIFIIFGNVPQNPGYQAFEHSDQSISINNIHTQ